MFTRHCVILFASKCNRDDESKFFRSHFSDALLFPSEVLLQMAIIQQEMVSIDRFVHLRKFSHHIRKSLVQFNETNWIFRAILDPVNSSMRSSTFNKYNFRNHSKISENIIGPIIMNQCDACNVLWKMLSEYQNNNNWPKLENSKENNKR